MLFVSLKKNIVFLRFCLCIFESDTVNDEIFKDLLQTVGLPY